MYIYYCDKCKSFESFVGADEEWKCKECGSDLWALGVTIDEWNAMTNDQMLDTIDFARAEYEKKNAKYDYNKAVMEEPKQPKPDVRVDLMECPDCFKSISPKSAKCPYCGHFFVNNPKAVRRRKAKRKLALKILLIGLIPAIIGAIYEAIIMSGNVLTGEITLMRATGTMLLYVVLYGGFVFLAIGLIMIIFGIVGIATNKPYIKEKVKEDDFVEGVIESGIVTHEDNEADSEVKDVIKPVGRKTIVISTAPVEEANEDETTSEEVAAGDTNEEAEVSEDAEVTTEEAVANETVEGVTEEIATEETVEEVAEETTAEVTIAEEVATEEVVTEEAVEETKAESTENTESEDTDLEKADSQEADPQVEEGEQ